jgi:hypothetical protein
MPKTRLRKQLLRQELKLRTVQGKQGHSLIRKGGFKTVSKQNQKITYKLILQREFILFFSSILGTILDNGNSRYHVKIFFKIQRETELCVYEREETLVVMAVCRHWLTVIEILHN